MRNQRGFTLTELALVLFFIAWACVVGGICYAIVHFILKFW